MLPHKNPFELNPVLNGKQFIEEFKSWLDYGKEKNILKKYEKCKYLNPLSSGKYLYLIFRNELKRDGQSPKKVDPDIYQKFVQEYPRGLNLTFNIDDRVIQTAKSLIICFPCFDDELSQKGWLLKWRYREEAIEKRGFYWQLWKLFFFEMRRRKLVENSLKRKQIFDKFWHGPKDDSPNKARDTNT